MEKIDFILPWVDNNDPSWQKEMYKYKTKYDDLSNYQSGDVRFRDWDLLKYWFRGVERFAPWVNNIYFITWGHIPKWLNINHPRLKIVKHKDFIPEKYLPTFNSHVIELYLHKIPDLNEHFVYFNDDIFLIDKVNIDDFFYNGLPCDEAILDYIPHPNYEDKFPHYLLNNVGIINRNFNFQHQIRRYRDKFINQTYEKFVINNEFFINNKLLPGFYTVHLPQAFNKSIFIEVWNKERKILEKISKNKFRTVDDVNQYLFRYWQLIEGKFNPVLYRKLGWSFGNPELEKKQIIKFIRSQQRKIICINDNENISDFKRIRDDIAQAFEYILPYKSKFEI